MIQEKDGRQVRYVKLELLEFWTEEVGEKIIVKICHCRYHSKYLCLIVSLELTVEEDGGK